MFLRGNLLPPHPTPPSLLQKNVHSKQFMTYMCDHVIPNLKSLASPDEETNIQLEVLKTFAEISEFSGDLDKIDTRVNVIFKALLVG